ncbi:Tetratricopeptide (TPR) repeat [Singulisphaera sp. GP187]|nr:Tetratricopeptide (TPR) repeat [Singulisphaera sp. GP187]
MRGMFSVACRLIASVVFAILTSMRSEATADSADRPAGVECVVFKSLDTNLRVARQVVPVGRKFHVYHVERVQGDWIWLVAEYENLKGWAKRLEVVPLDKATAYLTEVLKNDPGKAETYYHRGRTRSANGDNVHAIADFSEAIQLDSAFAAAYADRGYSRFTLKDFEAARKDFDVAIRIAPKSAEALKLRGYFFESTGMLEQANADYTEAITLDPTCAKLYFNRAYVLKRLSKDDDLILADYKAGFQLDPQSAMAQSNRGMFWKEKKDYKRALQDICEAIRIDPKTAAFYLNRAEVRKELKDYVGAIEDCDEALRLSPELGVVYLARASARRKKGDLDLALDDYSEAIQRAPEYRAFVYYDRSGAWLSKQNYDHLFSDLEEAARLETRLTPFADMMRAWVWATAPDPRIRDGRKAVAAALRVSTRAKELTDYNETVVPLILAVAYAESGDFNSAVLWQHQAIAGFRKEGRDCRTFEQMLKVFEDKKPYHCGTSPIWCETLGLK